MRVFQALSQLLLEYLTQSRVELAPFTQGFRVYFLSLRRSLLSG
jgi:hypothetical protein